MKKLFLVGALALGTLFASAQEKSGFEGRWFLGGTVGYFHEGNEQLDTAGIYGDIDRVTITPLIGYFITPTIAVGGQIGYRYSQQKPDAGGKIRTNDFIINPLVRKYLGLNDKVFFFGQFDVPIAFGNSKETGKDKVNYIDWGAYIRPGIDIFLTSNWSVETTLGQVGYGTHNPDGREHTDKSGISVDLSNINLGVKYVF